MTLTKEDVSAAWDDDLDSFTSGFGNFLTLDANKNVIRFLPNGKAKPKAYALPLPYVGIVQHSLSTDKQFTNVACLQFIYGREELLARAIKSNILNEKDVALIEKFGDPFSRLFAQLKADGVAWGDLPRQVQPQSKFFWNVRNMLANPEETVIFESSAKVVKGIKALVESDDYFNILSPIAGRAVTITGNGEPGLKRRYNDPVPVSKKSKVIVKHGTWKDSLHDLTGVVLSRVQPYKEVLKLYLEQLGDIAEEYGLGESAFVDRDKSTVSVSKTPKTNKKKTALKKKKVGKKKTIKKTPTKQKNSAEEDEILAALDELEF